MLSLLVSLATFAIAVAAQAPPDDAALVAQLITSNTQVNRINDIQVSSSLGSHTPSSDILFVWQNDTAFVFNFLNGARGTAKGGWFSYFPAHWISDWILSRLCCWCQLRKFPCSVNREWRYDSRCHGTLVCYHTPIFFCFTYEPRPKAVPTHPICILVLLSYRSLCRVVPSTLNSSWRTVQERSKTLCLWAAQQFSRK